MRSWVQVLETTSFLNAGKTAYIRPKMVGPFLGPMQAGGLVIILQTALHITCLHLLIRIKLV
jgi:hypothetical protein